MEANIGIEISPEIIHLAKTLGLLKANGEVDIHWFSEPHEKISTILTDENQRKAAIALAENLLGSTEQNIELADQQDQKQWLTLLEESTGDVSVGIYIIVDETDAHDGVKLSFGARLVLDNDDLNLALFLKVPLLQISKKGESSETSFLVEDAEQCMEIAASIELKQQIDTDGIKLKGACLTAKLPLNIQASNNASVSVTIKGLQLASQGAAQDIYFDSLGDEIASQVIDVLLSLLQIQEQASDQLKALLALIGLGENSQIPPLPIPAIAQQGLPAVAGWFRQIITSAPEEWYQELSKLLGRPANITGSGTRPDPYLIVLNDNNAWSPKLTFYKETGATGNNPIIHVGARFQHTPSISGAVSVRAFAEIEFMSISLSPKPVLIGCPELRLQLELQAINAANNLLDTDVDGRNITIKSVFTGFSLDASRKLIPVIEARGVQLDTHHYEKVKLSSSDALENVASDVLSTVMSEILALLDIDSHAEAHALATLAGLVYPTSLPVADRDDWSRLVTLPDFLQNPLGAISCYHLRVINQNGAWLHLANELALLLNHQGLVVPQINGLGTKESPWICTLFNNSNTADQVRGQTELHIYSAQGQADAIHTLFFEQHLQPFIEPINGKQLSISHVNEFLQIELPSEQTCPSNPLIKWMPSQRIRIQLAEDISIDTKHFSLQVQSIELELLWGEDSGLECEISIKNPSITLNGSNTSFNLPEFNLKWLDDLDLNDLDWQGIEALCANWFAGNNNNADGSNWGAKLVDLFAWLPNSGNLQLRLPNIPSFNLDIPVDDLPRLSLQKMLTDPVDGLLNWLKVLFSGGANGLPDFSLPALNTLVDFFSKKNNNDLTRTQPALTGQGTYADPWGITLDGEEKALELLLWVDPDGPSLAGLGDLVSHLLPAELQAVINDSNVTPDLNQLSTWLNRVANLVPQLRERLAHMGELSGTLNTLRSQLVDGDGLVLASDQQVSGWTNVDMATTINKHISHLSAPAAFNLDDYLPANTVPASRHVYLVAPIQGVKQWVSQNNSNNVIDLREAGLNPAAFDLSSIVSSSNNAPWFILLPTQSAASVNADVTLGSSPEPDSTNTSITGIEGQNQRLKRVIDAIAAAKGGNVLLIAHSISGLVARRLATAENSNISHIITLATPHNGSLLERFAQTTADNGIRLLQSLHRLLDNTHISTPDLSLINDLLNTLGSFIDSYATDSNGLSRHTPFPIDDFKSTVFAPLANGITAINVVTRIAPDVLDQAIAKFVHHVIDQALTFLPGQAGHGTISHIGFGFRSELSNNNATTGQIKVKTQLRVDLHQIELQNNLDAKRELPHLQLRSELSRQDGWLVEAPSALSSANDPRIRYAVMLLNASYAASTAKLYLYDASAFGIHHDLWDIEALFRSTVNNPLNTAIPQEVNVLLGRLAASFGTISESNPAYQFAKLLESLQIAAINANQELGFVADGVRRILIDPRAELEILLATNTPTRNQIINALRDLMGIPDVDNSLNNIEIANHIELALGEHFVLEIDLTNSVSLKLKTIAAKPLLIGDVLHLSGFVRASLDNSLQGKLQSDIQLKSIQTLTPFGRPYLRLQTQAEVQINNQTTLIPIKFEFNLDSTLMNSLPNAIELYPNVDINALAQWLRYTLPGEILRLIFNEVSQPIKPLLKTIGLIRDNVSNELDNFAGLLANPKAWLSDQNILGLIPDPVTGLQGLNEQRVRAMVNALRELLNLQAPDGILPLPANAQLSIQATGLAVDFILRLPSFSNVSIQHSSQATFRINPGLQIQLGINSSLSLIGLPQLNHARINVNLAVGNSTLELGISLSPKNGSNEVNIGLLPVSVGLSGLTGLANTSVDLVLPEVLKALIQLPDPLGNTLASLFDALDIRENDGFNTGNLRSLAENPAAYLQSKVSTQNLFSSIVNLANQALPSGLVTISSNELVIKPFHANVTLANIVIIKLTANKELQLRVTDLAISSTPEIKVDGALTINSNGLSSASFGARVADNSLLGDGIIDFLPFVSVSDAGVNIGLWLAAEGVVDRKSLSVIFANNTVLSCAGSNAAADCIKVVLDQFVLPLITELLISQVTVQGWLSENIHAASAKKRGDILNAAGILKSKSLNVYGMDPDGLLNDLINLNPADLGKNLSKRLWLVAVQFVDALTARPINISPFELRFAKDTFNASTVYGLNLNLQEPLKLGGADSQTAIELIVEDKSWQSVTNNQTLPGITFLAIATKGNIASFASLAASDAISFSPWIKVVGLGLKIADATRPKLIDSTVSVNSIHIDTIFERNFATKNIIDFAGGRITLDKLSIPIGSANGASNNPIASKMLADDSTDPQGDRESLSPTFTPQITIMANPEPQFLMSFLDGNDKPIWVPIQQKFGPMYVEQIGLDYFEGDINANDPSKGRETKTVSALFDGGMQISGLNIGVDDLKLTVPFQNPADVNNWELDLAGLTISYQGSGVNLAGGFRKVVSNNGQIEYSGLLQVDIAGFGGLTAIGSYGVFPISSTSGATYTSMFGFASLLAPIGGPPAFFVTGIGGGMGLNRALTLPDMDGVPSYPLVAALDSQSDFARNPMSALESFGTVFPPSRGKFWFAAGIRFTSFALVESVAVLALEASDEVEIQLLGLSRMVLPAADSALLSIELALRARISTRDQIMSIEAKLTDNSWLINEDCRLTGGFAFIVWFKPEESDFVLTLGGYHPNFIAPVRFPIVSRLGFSWTPGGGVTIKGESYFALTSSAVMAGGRLEVSYSQSIVWASLVAGMDILVIWEPLYYDFNVYIQISAGIRIRKCLKIFWTRVCISIQLSFSIGADIHIYGPELRGTATLDLDIMSVTVAFGAIGNTASKETLSWSKFHEKYIAQGDASEPTMGLSIPTGLLIPDSGENRDPDDGSINKPFRVTVEFSFEAHTRTASKTISFNTNQFTKEIDSRIGAKAMGRAMIDPEYSIKLFKAESSDEINSEQLSFTATTQKVPDGIWGADITNNPSSEPKSITALATLTVTAKSKLDNASRPNGVLVPLINEDGSFIFEGGEDTIRPLPFHQEQQTRNGFRDVIKVAADNIADDLRNTSSLEHLIKRTEHISSAAQSDLLSERAAPPVVGSLAEGMMTDKSTSPVRLKSVIAKKAIDDFSTTVGSLKLVSVLRQPPVLQSARELKKTSIKINRGEVVEIAPPNLANIQNRWKDHIVTRLDVVTPKITKRANTVIVAGNLPTTGVAGSIREWRTGLTATLESQQVIQQLEKNINSGIRIHSGDTQVWTLQNAQYDNQEERPLFAIDNKQVIRLVFIDPAGGILLQHIGKEQTKVEAPRGTQTIALSGLGNQHSLDGYAGWHRESLLQQVHARTYLAPEAIINVSGTGTVRKGRKQDYGQVKANDAFDDANAISTFLPEDIQTIAIVLHTELSLNSININELMTLSLEGAIQAQDDNKRSLPPTLVDKNGQLMAIFEIIPAKEPNGFVTVNIATEDSISVVAVVGAKAALGTVVKRLVDTEIQQLLKPISTLEPVSSSINWFDPQR